MAGQGKSTRHYASVLKAEGWNLLYMCIPNTPHVKVIPIPTSHGVSKQRYPDIAAVNQTKILLAEVEMNLTKAVAEDICLRFNEMRQALNNQETYRSWRLKVEEVSGQQLPTSPALDLRLKLVNPIDMKSIKYVEQLQSDGISVVPN